MHTNYLSSTDISNRGPVVAQAAAFSTTPRADLVVTSDIVVRMSRDMADILRYSAERVVRAHDLVLKGWTQAQITRHCEAAAVKAQDLLVSFQSQPYYPVATPDEASRSAPAPHLAVAAGTPFQTSTTEEATSLHSHLSYLHERNLKIADRVESLMMQMQNEMKDYKSLNATIKTTLQNLEAANA